MIYNNRGNIKIYNKDKWENIPSGGGEGITKDQFFIRKDKMPKTKKVKKQIYEKPFNNVYFDLLTPKEEIVNIINKYFDSQKVEEGDLIQETIEGDIKIQVVIPFYVVSFVNIDGDIENTLEVYFTRQINMTDNSVIKVMINFNDLVVFDTDFSSNDCWNDEVSDKRDILSTVSFKVLPGTDILIEKTLKLSTNIGASGAGVSVFTGLVSGLLPAFPSDTKCYIGRHNEILSNFMWMEEEEIVEEDINEDAIYAIPEEPRYILYVYYNNDLLPIPGNVICVDELPKDPIPYDFDCPTIYLLKENDIYGYTEEYKKWFSNEEFFEIFYSDYPETKNSTIIKVNNKDFNLDNCLWVDNYPLGNKVLIYNESEDVTNFYSFKNKIVKKLYCTRPYKIYGGEPDKQLFEFNKLEFKFLSQGKNIMVMPKLPIGDIKDILNENELRLIEFSSMGSWVHPNNISAAGRVIDFMAPSIPISTDGINNVYFFVVQMGLAFGSSEPIKSLSFDNNYRSNP